MADKLLKLVLFTSVVALLAGVSVGYIAGNSASDESPKNEKKVKNVSIDELKNRVSDFVNYNLLKPGVKAELLEASEEDQFYKFYFSIEKDGSKVADLNLYTTKDGEYVILNLIEIPENIEKVRTDDVVKNPSGTVRSGSQTGFDDENEPYIGDENADIVIVGYSSYSCPFSKRFTVETLPKIMENFSVKYVFKDFPVHGEPSIKAHEAAYCAAEQGKYWEYHDILFERQSEWRGDLSKLIDYAELLQLDTDEFKACLDSGKYREEVLKDREEGSKLGVKGTPTLFINGKKIVGAQPYRVFEEAIKEIQSQK